MTTTNEKEAAVLAEITGMIKEVMGDGWTDETVVTMATTFTYDLEVESIELISLAEKLQEKYGEQLNFPVWLAGKELDDMINLTVGELVEYIAATVEQEPA
jgi:acyl carrier protein